MIVPEKEALFIREGLIYKGIGTSALVSPSGLCKPSDLSPDLHMLRTRGQKSASASKCISSLSS